MRKGAKRKRWAWGLSKGHDHSLFIGDAKAGHEVSHSGAGKGGALSTAKKNQKAKGKTKKHKKTKRKWTGKPSNPPLTPADITIK